MSRRRSIPPVSSVTDWPDGYFLFLGYTDNRLNLGRVFWVHNEIWNMPDGQVASRCRFKIDFFEDNVFCSNNRLKGFKNIYRGNFIDLVSGVSQTSGRNTGIQLCPGRQRNNRPAGAQAGRLRRHMPPGRCAHQPQSVRMRRFAAGAGPWAGGIWTFFDDLCGLLRRSPLKYRKTNLFDKP